jgi:hypothetical protein
MLCGRSAPAEVITFDDVSAPGFAILVPSPYHTLNWPNFNLVNTVLLAGPSGYQNGTVSSPNVAFNQGGSPAAITGASPFTFNSGDFTGGWNDGLTIKVVGKLGGVAVLGDSTTFAVNTSGPTLETFDWANVDELDFSSSGGTHNANFPFFGTYFVMDNVTINEGATATPEPDLFVMVGLSGIFGVQRWKTAKN